MKQIFLFIIITLFILACKKADTELEPESNPFPPNTAIGANTFRFRVDSGKVINSRVGYLSSMPRIHVYYSSYSSIFTIEGGNFYLDTNMQVSIHINYMPQKGVYHMLDERGDDASYDEYSPIYRMYYTNGTYYGDVNITTLDTVKHIIAGTFFFKAEQWCFNKECNDIIFIDGQFDVTYTPSAGINYY